MKKILLISVILSISTSSFADSVTFFNVKEYTTGDAKGGGFIQEKREIKSLSKDSPQHASTYARTHDAKGKKNEFIKIEGKHKIHVINTNTHPCRGHLKYEIKSAGASFVHESDFQMIGASQLQDAGTTYSAVQKQQAGIWTIGATTQVTGQCGSNKNVDRAKLKIN